MDMFECGH